MMAALWGLLGLVAVLGMVIGLLVFTTVRQDTELREAKQDIITLRVELGDLVRNYYDFKQEFHDWVLGGEDYGDEEYPDGEPDGDRPIDADWSEFDPFADPPVRRASVLGSI